MATRQNQWFVPGTGIAREVITADIQRYLGPNALVRPGVGSSPENLGQQGYWITAYRTLTTNMIEDLKNDSLRWQQERQQERQQPGSSDREYQDSQTHRSRQHYGPTGGSTTTPYDQFAGSAYEDSRRGQTTAPARNHAGAQAGYASNNSYYVTTPTQQYQSSGGYQTAPASAAPRTQAVDPYTAYQQQQQQQQQQQHHQHQQSQPGQRDYASSPYVYQQGASVDQYGRPTPAPTTVYSAPSDANLEYYTASDGRRYPRSSMPQVGRR